MDTTNHAFRTLIAAAGPPFRRLFAAANPAASWWLATKGPALNSNAVISKTGKYRYTLTRDWGTGDHGLILWVMLNPSTADAETDDATIRRIVAFSQLWGFEAAAVVNLYAYRATKPADLWAAAKAGVDIIGPKNDKWITKEVYHAQRIICAWGANADFHRPREVGAILAKHRKKPWILGTTNSGHPLHPLRLAAATQPLKWKHPYGEGAPDEQRTIRHTSPVPATREARDNGAG